MALVLIFVIPLCATAHDSTLPLCNSQPMTDIMGHDVPDLPPGPPPTTDAEACCTKCKSYTECVAFVYEPKQGHCYLKRSLGKTNHNPERLLSFVNNKCSCIAGSDQIAALQSVGIIFQKGNGKEFRVGRRYVSSGQPAGVTQGAGYLRSTLEKNVRR